jgi:hypothetical protein
VKFKIRIDPIGSGCVADRAVCGIVYADDLHERKAARAPSADTEVSQYGHFPILSVVLLERMFTYSLCRREMLIADRRD